MIVSGRSVSTFLLTSRLVRNARLDTAEGMLPNSLSARFSSFKP